MFTISLSQISHTGFSSIALFLAHCKDNPSPVGGGVFRYQYQSGGREEICSTDLPFSYQQLKQAAKKEMMDRIHEAGLEKFISLKRKIILEDEYASPSPVYCLEFYPDGKREIHPGAKQTYYIHKALLFRFVREEEFTS
jgi:hypothetical protein